MRVKHPRILPIILVLIFGSAASAFAHRNSPDTWPVPMKRAPVGTNEIRCHTIIVPPRASVPKIHFYQKLNPVWWLQNTDDTLPPDWYRPTDKHRVTMWYFRNPFHNFNFYVVGVADKTFTRSGRFPELNTSPQRGWDLEIIRRRVLFLPTISYQHPWCTFYFGWRKNGAFGAALRFH